jgi:hypothetical protein
VKIDIELLLLRVRERARHEQLAPGVELAHSSSVRGHVKGRFRDDVVRLLVEEDGLHDFAVVNGAWLRSRPDVVAPER